VSCRLAGAHSRENHGQSVTMAGSCVVRESPVTAELDVGLGAGARRD
jgi:hypothetical protein